jgi:hypothetical protein
MDSLILRRALESDSYRFFLKWEAIYTNWSLWSSEALVITRLTSFLDRVIRLLIPLLHRGFYVTRVLMSFGDSHQPSWPAKSLSRYVNGSSFSWKKKQLPGRHVTMGPIC